MIYSTYLRGEQITELLSRMKPADEIEIRTVSHMHNGLVEKTPNLFSVTVRENINLIIEVKELEGLL